MSASHKTSRRFTTIGKKNPLDHVLDFGVVDPVPDNNPSNSNQSQNKRLKEVVRQIEEISRRIDHLMGQD